MARAKPWLKMWTEWVDDLKMLSLTLAEQGAWWRLVTLAQKCAADGALVKGRGASLSLDEIADAIRIKPNADRRVFDSMVEKMTGQGSLHWNHDTLVITNFKDRQAKVASETTEALRDRQQRRRQKLWTQYGIKDSSIPLETRRLVIERDECRCQLCGKQGVLSSPEATVVLDPEDNSPFEFDHIILKSQGGSDDPDNLRLSCRKCNRARGTQPSPPPLRTPSPDNIDKEEDEEAEEKHRDKSVTNLAPLAKIATLHEQFFGIITPVLSEKFKDFVDHYHGPVEWIDLAFAEAVKLKNRRWAYVEAILYSWQEKGGPHADRREPEAEGERPGAGQRDIIAEARAGGWEVLGDDEPETAEAGNQD